MGIIRHPTEQGLQDRVRTDERDWYATVSTHQYNSWDMQFILKNSSYKRVPLLAHLLCMLRCCAAVLLCSKATRT